MAADWPEERRRKFKHAAFAYLHVTVLYESAAFVMVTEGFLPDRFGSPWLWLVAGGVVGLVVTTALLYWQNEWFARAVWLLHGLRLPALIRGAFFAGADTRMPPSFYIMAMVVVVVNLVFLARAGWNL